MEADFSGTLVRALAEHELQNVFRVSWAPTSTAAILEYMDEFSERQIALFDVASGTTTPLHPNVRSIAWSPDGSALIYHWRDDLSGANAIFRSAPDTSNRSQLMPIQLPAVNIFWPAPDTIIIAQKPTPAIPSLVLVRDIRTGATNSLGEDKFGVSILPSPDGKKLLVSSTRDAEGSALVTEVYNLEGTLLAALPFATLAEKCAWGSDSETLFCAIPASLAGARALPFSYWIGALSTRDVFAAYTLTTGQMRMLSEVLPDVDAVDLVIPQTEDAIAFVNRLDGTLTVLRP
jgi:dipeptidyl aminopeptidase/acylaminoacyl peptidase